MTDDQARQAIAASIAEVAPDADLGGVADDDDLFEVLDLDSMDILAIVQGVHDRTGVDIPERDYPRLITMGGFADYLLRASAS